MQMADQIHPSFALCAGVRSNRMTQAAYLRALRKYLFDWGWACTLACNRFTSKLTFFFTACSFSAGMERISLAAAIIILTLGWVGYGERRHAELPREDLPSRRL
jgi:hypothetical protein